uniref:PEPxxWA-CTERM sorting domain-containing protein n=1 Tax=Sandarakinorhabdus sp. TaxID=1916663 RepID=UPI00286D7E04
AAVTNLIKNGSFEAGNAGTGGFLRWTKSNVPTNAPATIINYNSAAAYPTGAFGERVFPDNAISFSPDAAGTKAAYFVGDFSANETISQLTYLPVGNYRIGFSFFLPNNGLANVGNASFNATIVGAPVAVSAITTGLTGRTWRAVSAVGQITQAGHYQTAFVFNTNRNPSKDVVIDRAFAIRTTDPADIIIGGNPAAIPEPSNWMLLLLGFGLVGAVARRRKAAVSA